MSSNSAPNVIGKDTLTGTFSFDGETGATGSLPPIKEEALVLRCGGGFGRRQRCRRAVVGSSAAGRVSV